MKYFFKDPEVLEDTEKGKIKVIMEAVKCDWTDVWTDRFERRAFNEVSRLVSEKIANYYFEEYKDSLTANLSTADITDMAAESFRQGMKDRLGKLHE